MTRVWFHDVRRAFWRGEIDLLTDAIQCALLMSDSTALTDLDALSLAGITTLDEFDGSGYARQVLASKEILTQNEVYRDVFRSADPLYSGIQAGSRQIAWCMLLLQATNKPLLLTNEVGMPLTVPAGTHNLTVRVNPADGWGILRL